MNICNHCHSPRLCETCHALYFDDDIPPPLAAHKEPLLPSKIDISSGEDAGYVNQDGVEAMSAF